MKIEQLIKQWNALPHEVTEGEKYDLMISAGEAAKIEAIKELYPGLTSQMVIHQLLIAALNSFEEALPYVQGNKVIGEDEFGDPIYEDAGDTPKYLDLSKKHYQRLISDSTEMQ
jgi:hypothetical protein